MIDEQTEAQPHQWPGCPWPGWAQIYARLIRDCRALDPGLVIEMHAPGTISFDSVTTFAGDALFDRMEQADYASRSMCVVCGAESDSSLWPPLCDVHA